MCADAFRFVVQLLVVVLAAAGQFTLWGAVLVDAATAIIVILNGMFGSVAVQPTSPDSNGCGSQCSSSCDKPAPTHRHQPSCCDVDVMASEL